jgi:hypothetical protein
LCARLIGRRSLELPSQAFVNRAAIAGTEQERKGHGDELKYAALLVALLYIVVGLVGLVSPDTLMGLRQQYFVTVAGLYTGGAVRVVMGLVLILVAPTSRSPKVLGVLGAIICLQGLAAAFSSVELAQAVLEAEARNRSLLPVGAFVALTAGGFIAYVVLAGRRSDLT